MELKKFIEKYREGNNASLAREIDMDKSIITYWLKQDVHVSHDRGRLIGIKSIRVIYPKD